MVSPQVGKWCCSSKTGRGVHVLLLCWLKAIFTKIGEKTRRAANVSAGIPPPASRLPASSSPLIFAPLDTNKMKTSLACLALAGSAAAFAPAQQASFSTKLNSAVPEGYDDLIGECFSLRPSGAGRLLGSAALVEVMIWAFIRNAIIPSHTHLLTSCLCFPLLISKRMRRHRPRVRR